jgi:hypothetical protein
MSKVQAPSRRKQLARDGEMFTPVAVELRTALLEAVPVMSIADALSLNVGQMEALIDMAHTIRVEEVIARTMAIAFPE